MHSNQNHSPTDRLLTAFGHSLETLFASPKANRIYPGKTAEEELSEQQRRQSAGYMRVNHVGEVCAQALYQSQALTCADPKIQQQMQSAADEETDHLAWCEQRLQELGSRKSYLNPLWYTGSFAIGAAAGLMGDKWNLGFVAETERQVVEHLESHLSQLPENDQRSREVVAQMQRDEAEHEKMAMTAGAAELPEPVKKAMAFVSGIMTRTAFWL